MSWRIAGFVIAAAELLVHFVSLLRKKEGLSSPQAQAWSRRQLMIASFLTLFAELAIIRWIGTEVRIFAYVKNLALLLCFLGFGMGCALVRRPIRWWTSATALLGLLLIVRWPWHGDRIFE